MGTPLVFRDVEFDGVPPYGQTLRQEVTRHRPPGPLQYRKWRRSAKHATINCRLCSGPFGIAGGWGSSFHHRLSHRGGLQGTSSKEIGIGGRECDFQNQRGRLSLFQKSCLWVFFKISSDRYHATTLWRESPFRTLF